MIGFAQFVPLLCLSLLIGSTEDRRDRRRIILIGLAVETVCVLVLLALAFRPVPSFAVLLVVAAVSGSARAIISPATSAFVPMLVARPDMARAISLNSLAWRMSVVLGPSLGALPWAYSVSLAYGVTAAIFGGQDQKMK